MTSDFERVECTYQSPDRPVSWLARCWPGAVFYCRIAAIIVSAAKLAKNGLYETSHWIESSRSSVRAVESVGGHCDFQGLDIVAQLRSPCVFIGNHMSILETFILPCLIAPHREVTFVVKESLINYPFFGHVMRNRNPVVVGRDNPREDLRVVLEEGEKRLQANISIVIFPQTTRSVEFDPKKFNSLGVKLARRASVPVVPFALKTDAWGLGRRIKDFGRICPEKTVHIHFGEPMTVRGSGKEEHAAVVEFIERNLAVWRNCEFFRPKKFTGSPPSKAG